MKEFRMAVVGYGQIAPATVAALADSDFVKITAVVDIDPAALSGLRGDADIRPYGDYYSLLENSEIDGVYLSIPHMMHTPYAIEAARAGKHVMIEKPFAINERDGRLMLAEFERAKITAGVCMPLRYTAPFRTARKWLETGALGNIISTRTLSISHKKENYWTNGVGGQARRSSWRAYKSTAGGGILIMNAIHNIDAVLYLSGLAPVQAYAAGNTFISPASVEDAISVIFKYDGGAYGVVEAMSAAVGGIQIPYNTWIYGTKGQIRLSDKAVGVFTETDTPGLETEKWNVFEPEECDSRKAVIEDWAKSALEGGQPEVCASAGYLVMSAILAAYRSMESGESEEIM